MRDYHPWWEYWLKAVLIAVVVFCFIILCAVYSQWKADQDDHLQCIRHAQDYPSASLCG